MKKDISSVPRKRGVRFAPGRPKSRKKLSLPMLRERAVASAPSKDRARRGAGGILIQRPGRHRRRLPAPVTIAARAAVALRLGAMHVSRLKRVLASLKRTGHVKTRDDDVMSKLFLVKDRIVRLLLANHQRPPVTAAIAAEDESTAPAKTRPRPCSRGSQAARCRPAPAARGRSLAAAPKTPPRRRTPLRAAASKGPSPS